MAQQRPADKPLWATAGINILPDFTAPLSEGPGYVANQKPPFQDWNTIWHRNGNWVKYFDENVAHIKDWAGEANANRIGLFTFSYVVGGGSLTAAAIPGGVYWIDGVRVEIDTAKLTKLFELNHSFNPNKDTYVSITGDSETPLVFTEVNNGDPAPAPPPGFTNIIRVVSDAVEVTFVQQLLSDTVSTKYPFYFEVLCSGEQCFFSPVTNPDNTAGIFSNTANGDAIYAEANGFGHAINALSFGSGTTLRARTLGIGAFAGEFVGGPGAPALNVVGVDGGVSCLVTSGIGLSVTAVGTAIGATINSSSGNALFVNSSNALAMNVSGAVGGIVATCGSGTCIDAQSPTGLAINAAGGNGCIVASSTSGACIVATASVGAGVDATGTSRGVIGTAIAMGGSGVQGIGTFTSSIGVRGEGLAKGVRGTASDADGYGVEGIVGVASNTSAAGVRGISSGTGRGGYFVSTDGYGVNISTSGTQRPALRIETQGSDPATLSTGDMWFHSSQGPKFRQGTDNRRIWGTPAGMLAAEAGPANLNVLMSDPLLTVVSKTLNLPAGSSALVMMSADIRSTGDSMRIDVRAYIDALLAKQSVFVLGPVGVAPDSSLAIRGTFFYMDWIPGPVTEVSLRTEGLFGDPAFDWDIANAKICVMGTVKTSDII